MRPAYNGRLPTEMATQVDDRTKTRLGIAGVVVGSAIFMAGVFIAHFTGLAAADDLGREIYPAIPRGWQWVLLGQLIALAGSQVLLAGIVLGWLWDRPMTWALANVGAMVFTVEMIIVFGIVPNEWLGLTQGTFEWTSQREAFTIPEWAVLNNQVSVSFGAIKDAVSGGYSATMLGVVLVAMYQLQEWKKKGRTAKPQPVSTYGRPIVKGDQ